jgi:hypothetical protein
MPAMLILDRHRALDFMIASSMRAVVPEPFTRLQREADAALSESSTVLVREPVFEATPAASEVAGLPEPVPAAPAPARPSAPFRTPTPLAAFWRGFRAPVAWSA